MWGLKIGLYMKLDFAKSRKDIKEMIDDLKSLGGVNYVLLLTKSKQGVCYPSKYADNVYNDERYKEVVKELKDNSIKVHAWFCLYIEDVKKPSRIVKENPDILIVNKYGKSNLEEPTWSYIKPEYSVYWVCPSSELYRNYLIKLMEEVVTKYDLDGIHLDYVRYPEAIEGRYYCYCKRCLQRFKEEYGYSFPTNDVVKIRYYVTILCENVSNSVKEFSTIAREYGCEISAYVFTDYTTAIEACYQDWPYFSQYLDFIIPTMYEVAPSWMKTLIRRARHVTNNRCEIHPAIYTNTVVRRAIHNAKRWCVERNAEYIMNSIRTIKDGGADGVVLFHYETLFGKGKTNNLPRDEVLKMINAMSIPW